MPKFGLLRSRCRLAAWPIGETSPGPCQAVRTLQLAERSHLARGCDAAKRAEMHARKVDQPFGHQRNPLALVHEQLAHGDRRSALGAQITKPVGLLGCQRIFEEKQLVWFNRLGQLNRLWWGQPLVD